MFAAVFALSLAWLADAPAGRVPVVAAACAPAQDAACPEHDRQRRDATIRMGKRCHPDPTKSKSCREVLLEQTASKEAALAEAR